MCFTGLRVRSPFCSVLLHSLILSQTHSGRQYSAWGDATVVQIDVDARPLLQRALDADVIHDYDNDASPEFTPTMSRLSTAPSTPPPLSSDSHAAGDPTLQTLQEASKRLQDLPSMPFDPAPSRKCKRNAKKREIDRDNGATKEHTIDPLKERRKVRSSVSNKYTRPRIIKADFVLAALTIAKYANVGVNRPAGHSVPSLEELQRANPNFTVIRNPDL